MALAANRDTPEMAINTNGHAARSIPCAAAVTLYAGALVCTTAGGLATPGATATTLVAAGRCEELADNAAGAASAISAKVKPGVFRFANSTAADAIAQSEVNEDCYVVDDETVAKTDGGATRSIAGKVIAVDSDGVWVAVGLKAIYG